MHYLKIHGVRIGLRNGSVSYKSIKIYSQHPTWCVARHCCNGCGKKVRRTATRPLSLALPFWKTNKVLRYAISHRRCGFIQYLHCFTNPHVSLLYLTQAKPFLSLTNSTSSSSTLKAVPDSGSPHSPPVCKWTVGVEEGESIALVGWLMEVLIKLPFTDLQHNRFWEIRSWNRVSGY